MHSLTSSCFIKKSAFNVAGNLVMVVKFTFQYVFGNSGQNPRHFSARGREESLLWVNPLICFANIKTKDFTSWKSFCRSGSQTLFFGGREATTGNASAVRRLTEVDKMNKVTGTDWQKLYDWHKYLSHAIVGISDTSKINRLCLV